MYKITQIESYRAEIQPWKLIGKSSSSALHPNASQVKMKIPQSCPILCNPTDSPWNSPGQNTGVGSCSPLQLLFPAQGSNPDLPHCRQIVYLFLWMHQVLAAVHRLFAVPCKLLSRWVPQAQEHTSSVAASPGLVALQHWDLNSPIRDGTRLPCTGR